MAIAFSRASEIARDITPTLAEAVQDTFDRSGGPFPAAAVRMPIAVSRAAMARSP